MFRRRSGKILRRSGGTALPYCFNKMICFCSMPAAEFELGDIIQSMKGPERRA